MQKAREIVEKAHAIRKEKGILAPPSPAPLPKKEPAYSMLPKDLKETPKDAPFFSAGGHNPIFCKRSYPA